MMISPYRKKQLKELEEKLKTPFLNQALFNQALTHSSYAYELRKKGKKEAVDNERLEFLGDAVLKLVISEYILNKYPTYTEGELTKIRATVVSDETLTHIASQLNLGFYLLLGLNEKRTGGRRRRSNLANGLEALLGAAYLDQGIGKTRDLILELLKAEVEKVSQVGYIRDYKSALQEFVQKKRWGLPHYKVTREMGPRHKRIFLIEVKVKGKKYGQGKGRSKKEAGQGAAREALANLTTGKGKRRGGLIQRFISRVREKKTPLKT